MVNLDDPSDVAAWNRRAPAPAPTDADIIALADKTRTGEPGRDGYILPISFARAVLAKWGTPAPASQPVAAPAGMEPVARIRYERNTPGRENEMPRVVSCNRLADGIYDVFTAAQVQAMLAAAPRNATLYNPDDVAFPVQRCTDGTDAPPELTSIAAVGVAAEEVAAPSAPAREPLTDEQIDEIHLANSDAYERGDVEYESHGFARAIEQAHGIKATNQESNK